VISIITPIATIPHTAEVTNTDPAISPSVDPRRFFAQAKANGIAQSDACSNTSGLLHESVKRFH